MEQGFGAMGLSAFYGSASKEEEEKIGVLKAAVDKGVTIINSAVFYGPLHEEGYGDNLRLLAKALQSGLDREKVQFMVKVGMDTRATVDKPGTQWKVASTAEEIRADVELALQILGVNCLDIAVLCRVPTEVGIEIPIAELAELVKEGKVKHIGVSEASPENIRRAHAVHPLLCIEEEWSLWTREIEEGIVPTCAELGIAIVAYSPLGRGFLTGTLRSRTDPAFSAHDFRLHMYPRMSEKAFDDNLKLIDGLKPICEARGCSQSQLALAWLQSQGRKFGVRVIPIPGTSKLAHLEENLAARNILITAEEDAAIEAIFDKDIEKRLGTRYAHMALCWEAQVNTASH